MSFVPHSSCCPAFDNMVSSLSLLRLVLLGHSVLLWFWTVGGRFASGDIHGTKQFLFFCACVVSFPLPAPSFVRAFSHKVCLSRAASVIVQAFYGVTAEGVEPAAAFAIGRTAHVVYIFIIRYYMCGYKVFYNAPTLRIHFVSASLHGRGIISRTQAQCSCVTSGLRFRHQCRKRLSACSTPSALTPKALCMTTSAANPQGVRPVSHAPLSLPAYGAGLKKTPLFSVAKVTRREKENTSTKKPSTCERFFCAFSWGPH